MLFVLFRIAEVLLNILWWIIVIQAVMSWLIAFFFFFFWFVFVCLVWNALKKMTDPFYNPIRRFLPDFGGLDLSPMVVLLIIYILMTIILPQLYVTLAGGVV